MTIINIETENTFYVSIKDANGYVKSSIRLNFEDMVVLHEMLGQFIKEEMNES